MSTKPNSNLTEWPPLPYADWAATRDTLHMWTQVVGKTRMVLSQPQNHWWHVALYVTPRGLTTSLIPSPAGAFDIEFDFTRHQLVICVEDAVPATISLHSRSVADFYAEYMARMRSLGIDVKINRKPQEVEDTTPFDRDEHHNTYNPEQVRQFHRALLHADRLLKQFRSNFIGKCSPAHFFWGSFDLCVTRFSGRAVKPMTMTDPIMREAYSHEVSSCGFWPGSAAFPHAAFYAYMAPVPAGLDQELLRAGAWNPALGEHILKYDEARALPEPDAAILNFFEDSYRAGSRLANWDTAQLERTR